MLRSLRVALLWLLTLAVPLQGFAAATMLFCATGSSHGHGTDHEHVHVVSVGHEGMHEGRGIHDHSHAAVPADHDHGSSVHKVAGKCNTCAACCTAVAMPVTIIEFKPIQAESSLIAIEPQAEVVFLTDGQERPPRTILA